MNEKIEAVEIREKVDQQNKYMAHINKVLAKLLAKKHSQLLQKIKNQIADEYDEWK